MGWKLIGKPTVVRATNALATHFMGMEAAPSDRPMNTDRKKKIRNAILEGRFRTCEWAEVLCKENGKTYRVNGKHTSTILSEMNGEAPKDLCIIHEKYECEKLTDVANLYATFDIRNSMRTTSDINVAYAATVPDLATIPRKIINLCVTAMAYHAADGRDRISRNPLPEERAQRLLTNVPFVQFVHRMITKSAEQRHVMRAPVVAAMYATFKKNSEAASEFWELVRDESHASTKDATRVLAKFLVRNRVRTTSGEPAVSEHAMYVKCLHAWNAWRQKSTTVLQYHADKPAPALV